MFAWLYFLAVAHAAPTEGAATSVTLPDPNAVASLEGHWRITWTRPGKWWPKDFTGPLVLRRENGAWTATVSFDQSGGAFDLAAVNIVDRRMDLVFAIQDTTFELQLQASGEGITGQARWVGSIGWSPVKGTRITPAPADLPGKALRPFRAGIAASESKLLGPDAFDTDRKRAPTLSEDGRRVWMVGGGKLWTGDADHPDQATAAGQAPANGWWGSDPKGELLYVAAGGRMGSLTRTGTFTLLAEDLGDIQWVEPRWSEGRLIIATRKDRLRVLDVPLSDGRYTEIFSDPNADDVVFDAAWKPRFLLDRESKHFGTGVDADLLTIQDLAGHMLGTVVRQPDWVGDTDPAPRAAKGPVYLLGGGDLVSVGKIGKKGFVEEPLEGAWGDATALVVDPETGLLDAVAWQGERLHWQAFTPDGQDLVWLQEKLGADVDVQQRVAADRRWVVKSWSGSAPARYWRFDRDDRSLVELVAPGEGENRAFHPVDAVVVNARDGLPLAAYVTRPAGKGPWPLIVEVHGGPWAGHHAWTIDDDAQHWAERGYATLAVNFRGTRGYGWKLMESSEFGDDPMIHDVEDAIRWAIDTGIADASRIAMVGASYGGYAALRFVTAEKPMLKCAAAGLVRGNVTVPGGGFNIYAIEDEAVREARSPDRFTDRISGPVLVWNGGRDGDNADAIQDFVTRAEAVGKAVTWVRFPWEEHGLSVRANRAALQVIQDRFLGACLGGPAWEFPASFERADLEVRAGEQYVPGLAERVR